MISPTNTASLLRAAELLRSGELVAFPTETVYGLGANALDARAVQRIYEAKGRPATSPLIVHVNTIAMARSLASQWPDAAEKLAQAFWPGPLTLVVPKAAHVPDAVTAGLPSVGLRLPAHEAARALITAAGLPLAAPSANRFTGLSPTTALHVQRALGGRVSLILDSGPCDVGIESTVVSISAQGEVTLLRPGMITSTQLEAVLGHPLAAPAPVKDGDAHLSPGQHQKHYSPRTPVLIAGRDAVPPTATRLLRLNAASLPAAELYATLHRADEAAENYDAILVELPPDTPEWAAVRDRLLRAAAQVI
jgi:L-threonylcarbamoyladenylate synthase